ncbi:MAG: phospholipase [Planctomycetes bacterium]|nr:phospholipase [Planctomycetota bacterium]
MSGIGAVLRQLHRIHRQLGDLRDRLERGPRMLKAREANVAKAEAELNQIKSDQKAARMAVDQKQLQLKSGESKLADLRTKLNTANSNREYQAFRDQIAADEMAGSVLSDEILEGMEKLETFKKQVAESEQRLALVQQEHSKAQKQVQEQSGLIAGDVTRLETELRPVEKQLPPEALEFYLRVVNAKGFEAMAEVEGDSCGGCFQHITPNMQNSLALDKVVQCQTCGRLLYLPEDRMPNRSRAST